VQRAAAAEVLAARALVREERREQSALAEAAVAEAARGCARQERAVERARRESAAVGAELAAVNQFLRSHAAAGTAAGALEGALTVAHGYELALAATLGGGSPPRSSAIARRRTPCSSARAMRVRGRWSPTPGREPPPPGKPPVAGARALVELLSGDPRRSPWPRGCSRHLGRRGSRSAAGRLQRHRGDTCRPRLERCARRAATGPSGGRERALEQRNRREALIGATERAAQQELGPLGRPR